MLKRNLLVMAIGLALLIGGALAIQSVPVQAQTPATPPAAPLESVPPIPMILAGTAEGAPDGFNVIGRIGNFYESPPRPVRDGKYQLTIAPPSLSYSNELVSVFLEGVEANEQIPYTSAVNHFHHNLTFPYIPEATLTPTPVPVLPAIYEGTITIAGAAVPDNATLVARVGDYESRPAFVEGNEFKNLVIITTDERLVNQPVEFFLNGSPSTPRAHGTFEPNSKVFLDLVFAEVPPTETPVPDRKSVV